MNRTLEQIKPETIELIEQSAARSGVSVDEFLKNLLTPNQPQAASEPLTNNHGEPQTQVEREVKRRQSIAWIQSHRAEYGGKYVALDGDQLIAVADKYGDALKTARAKGCQNVFIGDVLPLDYEGRWESFD